MHILRDWIPLDKINVEVLSENPLAFDFLQEHPDLINWSRLSKNSAPWAVELLQKNPSFINFGSLSCNPAATDLIRRSFQTIDWAHFSSNTSQWAVDYLKEHRDHIYWASFSSNPTAFTSGLLLGCGLVNMSTLSKNPAAIGFLRKNPDKIDWNWLSANPEAIDLLLKNPDKIYWPLLSRNPAAIDVLEKNKDKINWCSLALNPAIFVKGGPRCMCTRKMTRRQVRTLAWEYPREYLKLDLIRRKLMRAFLDTRYKLCRTRMLREFSRF